ncbi:NAD(P)-dependent oxidoreductase [Neomoorella mulderi]|uniref:Tartronate semialdehyde reductase n=1 Tax=Moorella mulderi DSM 14980 TaxID=1122241 RepID=A0A151ASP5_9FIRM|nr:DUF1932 domain-containing protein [Moorella mulderi]KYH30678.1 tartronate semialdehyde reductase [Moorella mulderi DSM 14980]
MKLKVGFIGFGEVGFAFSKGLKGAGLESIYAYDKEQDREPFSQLIQKRACLARVKLVANAEELVAESAIIICAVPSTASLQAAKEALGRLNGSKLYVDLTSSRPEVKKEIASMVTSTGASFVDAAIVAPVPQYGHKATMFASGSGSKAFRDALAPYGMDIRIVSTIPGQASLLKMLRSAFTKGLEALLLETMVAARKFNAEDVILNSIAETIDGAPFVKTVNRHICENAIHAKRRVHEMEDVAKVLKSAGVEPIVVEAAVRRLQWSANFNLKEHFQGEPPDSYKTVLAAIESLVGKE